MFWIGIHGWLTLCWGKRKRNKTGTAWKWEDQNVALHDKKQIRLKNLKGKLWEKRERICCANICFCIFQEQTEAQCLVHSDCILICSTKLTMMRSVAFCFIKSFHLQWIHLIVYNNLQAFNLENYSIVWHKILPAFCLGTLYWCLCRGWAPRQFKDPDRAQIATADRHCQKQSGKHLNTFRRFSHICAYLNVKFLVSCG